MATTDTINGKAEKELELSIWKREQMFIQQQLDSTKNQALKLQLEHQRQFVKELLADLRKK